MPGPPEALRYPVALGLAVFGPTANGVFLGDRLELLRVLEEVTHVYDLASVRLKQCDPLVLIRFALAAHPPIGPVHGCTLLLTDDAPDLEGQAGIPAKKYPEEFDDPLGALERLGLGK